MMTTLYWVSAESVTLIEAVSAAALPIRPIGMVSTTAWHGFVLAEAGTLRHAGETVDPATVFDARFFAPGPVELRWVHENAGLGRAVLLAQDEAVVRRARPPFGSLDFQHAHGTVEQTMLLWGAPHGEPSDGWTTLREHRVGALRVPGLPTPSPRQRAVLRLREYLAEDHYGNAFVLDELLLGLDWLDVRTIKEDVA